MRPATIRVRPAGERGGVSPRLLLTWEGQKMSVQWNKDAEAALAEAKESEKPLLVDFSAAPA